MAWDSVLGVLNHYRLGRGEPLVLIHGIGSRWQMWEPVLGDLVTRHEVIALDLPGFGISPMPPPGTPPGPASLVSLVLEFLDGLGIHEPHAAGNSLGGLIVLEMARQGRVRSATALSPAGFASRFETAVTRALLLTSVRVARALAGHAERLLATPTARQLALNAFMARPANLSVSEAAGSVRALAAAPWFDATLPTLAPMLFSGGEGIAVPTTVAWGDKDRVLPPRQSARAAKAIPSARVLSLEGCGHVPTYDDPDRVARILLQRTGAG
ncbi:MAG: alpha/beta fold hydrolase [Actinomycetota bacterium]|nr:alpha/beta fold hydrolase [Actinomycetota bacterium]